MSDDLDSPPGWKEFRLPDRDFRELIAMSILNPEGTASPGYTAHRRRFSEHAINTGVRNTSDANSTSIGILSDPRCLLERPRFPKGQSQRETLEVADRIPLGGGLPHVV